MAIVLPFWNATRCGPNVEVLKTELALMPVLGKVFDVKLHIDNIGLGEIRKGVHGRIDTMLRQTLLPSPTGVAVATLAKQQLQKQQALNPEKILFSRKAGNLKEHRCMVHPFFE